jgi:hypothetical protein
MVIVLKEGLEGNLGSLQGSLPTSLMIFLAVCSGRPVTWLMSIAIKLIFSSVNSTELKSMVV